MKKLLIFLLSLLPILSFGMDPYWTNNVWLTSNDVNELQFAVKERGYVVGHPYTPGAGSVATTSVGYVCNFGLTLDNIIASSIPHFTEVTNFSEGFFNESALYPIPPFDYRYTENIPYWTGTNLYKFLTNNFVNIDGTVGVGATNKDTFLFTQSWETNKTYCLGTITYGIASNYIKNSTSYYALAWTYDDGDRIVERYDANDSSQPAEWRYYINDKNGYWIYSTRNYGMIFDWTDKKGITNFIVCRPANTNIGLATNLNLIYKGLTNYNISGSDYTSWISNSISTSTNATNYILELIYDLGGYPDADSSHLNAFTDGLILTNTETVTTNLAHLGDQITFNLLVPNRLYANPGGYSAYPAYGPWADRRAFNERYAVLQCLKVTKNWNSGSWQSKGELNEKYATAVGYNFPVGAGWSDAKNNATSIYSTNSPFAADDYPVCYSRGWHPVYPWYYSYLKRRFARYETTDPITNYGRRVDFYEAYKPPYYYQGAYGEAIPKWDNNGDDHVRSDQWVYFSTTNCIAGTNAISEILGNHSNQIPNWCDEPPYSIHNGGLIQGWEANSTFYLNYWDFKHATNSI